ncbi:hypothetical protein LR48_Vigan233s000900 [Vigna angularis]|uniref:Uncharacterized protein n=1 Tax=Phaseolus angularis TaxID=3914 RepID=A0A0L9T6D1_PHAAN|nr:hypothetical protein LR48_Vigan233s000900 [Vigna angularis]
MKEFQVSEVAARENGVFEKVSMKDLFKYRALYFLGSLVLQTIYAVWAIGNYKHNRQYGDLEIDGRESEDGKTVSLSVNDVSGEQLLMEEKIEEIRLMAKEARRLESEKKGEEDVKDEDVEIDDDECAVSSRRDDIEKEITKVPAEWPYKKLKYKRTKYDPSIPDRTITERTTVRPSLQLPRDLHPPNFLLPAFPQATPHHLLTSTRMIIAQTGRTYKDNRQRKENERLPPEVSPFRPSYNYGLGPPAIPTHDILLST